MCNTETSKVISRTDPMMNRNVRGYVVIRRSAEEMLSIRRLMVHEADTDTDDTDVF